MQYRYEPETLDSVNEFIESSLLQDIKACDIAKELYGGSKAELILVKEFGEHRDILRNRKKSLKLLEEYIRDGFKYIVKRSFVSPVIENTMKENFYGIDLDEYADYLTELLSVGAYKRVNHHITNIMASYEPYMKKENLTKFESMTKYEHEVSIINFVKENLIIKTMNVDATGENVKSNEK